MKSRILSLFLAVCLMLFAAAGFAEPVPEVDLPRAEATLSMMNYLESDPELFCRFENELRMLAEAGSVK